MHYSYTCDNEYTYRSKVLFRCALSADLGIHVTFIEEVLIAYLIAHWMIIYHRYFLYRKIVFESDPFTHWLSHFYVVM